MNFNQKLKYLKDKNLYRKIKVFNNDLINFCSNDYLALKNHPEVVKAFKQGVNKFGVGSGSSHLISGHLKPHQKLEEVLADYTKQEKVLLFSTGYMANLGIFSALKDDLNWILQDKLNHASLIDANFLINKKIQRYQHNNINALQQKLNKQNGYGLVATDAVFSMNGNLAKISEISQIIDKDNVIFMQDDAHGFGLYPPNIPKNSIYMATFSKAIGVMGAFVAGNVDFINYLQQKSRPYIYTTAMPPAIACAILKSLEIVRQKDRQQQLFNKIKLFKTLIKIKINSNTAIQPIIIGDNVKALNISQYLLKNGFLVQAIRPPTVKQAILRITINVNHTNKQIKQITNFLNDKL